MEKEGEKGIGSAAVATTGTTPSDHSATDASNPASSSTPKPPLIPSGSLVLAIGSAPVSYFAPNHLQINQFLFFFVYSWLCFMNWALGPVFVFSHLISSHFTSFCCSLQHAHRRGILILGSQEQNIYPSLLVWEKKKR